MLKSLRIVPAIALVAVAGCHDTTSPVNTPFTVTVSVVSQSAPQITDTPNGPVITCEVTFKAEAHGTGSATWSNATELWYAGPDRSTSIATTSTPASLIQSAYGGAQIAGGESRQSTWDFHYSAPFEASFVFAYTLPDGKSTSTASARFACGPTPAGAVVPVITHITLPSTTGELKLGDTVAVSYGATGSSGIWATIVDATGAFISEQVIGEHLATGVERTAKFVVTSGNHPGVPLTISVRAFNAALVGTAKSLETQLTFADHTPPTISQVFGLGGQFAVGDTVSLSAMGTDDNLLGWLVYQLGPPANVRDSVAATPGHAAEDIVAKFVVRPEWVGTPLLSMYMRDAAGLTSQTVTSKPDSLRFYPVVNHPVTTPLVLSPSFDAGDMVYDEKRDLMYVGVPGERHIVVFSPSTMTAQTPITLAGAPSGMDLSLSGDSLLVAVPTANEIDVVDLTHPSAPPGAIKLSPLNGVPIAPDGLRIAANGKMMVLLSYPTATNDQVVEVDLTSGTQRIRTDARNLSTASPLWTRSVGRPNDRSRIYVLGSCGTIYDSATDAFMLCRNGSFASSMGLTFDAADTHVTRGNVVFDASLTTMFNVGDINGKPPYVAISPDGATLYLGAGQDIRTMRFADHTMLERIPIPVNAERVFVSPSGAWLLAFQVTNGVRATRVDLR